MVYISSEGNLMVQDMYCMMRDMEEHNIDLRGAYTK